MNMYCDYGIYVATIDWLPREAVNDISKLISMTIKDGTPLAYLGMNGYTVMYI